MSSQSITNLLAGYYDPRDFGYIANASYDNRRAVQAALDAANAAGGGRVVLPPGTTGIASTLYLDNYVTIDVPAGATLKALAAFVTAVPYLVANRLYASTGNTEVRVIGRGTLDGSSLATHGVVFGTVTRGAIEPSTTGLTYAYSCTSCTGIAFPRFPGASLIDAASGAVAIPAGGLVAAAAGGADLAAAQSVTVAGAAIAATPAEAQIAIECAGVRDLVADAPISAGDVLKVGSAGYATAWKGAQVTIQATITGEASAFTQPAGATALEIVQAADVAADRGRGIVIVGADGTGAAITETITLNATNTTTAHAGSTSFTTVSGVYTANGANLGAQNVTIRASGGGATVCTLTGGSSELGADIPSGTQEGYCDALTLTGPNSDTTQITIVGYDSTNTAALERATLDGASPSKVTTTAKWRYISRICLGEFTNAGAGAVKTDSTVDTAAMKIGQAVAAAASRGATLRALIKANVI